MAEPRRIPEFAQYVEEYGIEPEDEAAAFDAWIIKRYGRSWEEPDDSAEQ